MNESVERGIMQPSLDILSFTLKQRASAGLQLHGFEEESSFFIVVL